jgi:hypothetical protein
MHLPFLSLLFFSNLSLYSILFYKKDIYMLKKSFDNLISGNPQQLILGIIFVFYILLNVQTPEFLAGAIDNIFGKVLVVAIAVVIFIKTNPVIGVLGLVVAYQMIKTASVTTGTYALKHYLPSEQSKFKEMQSFNTENIQPLHNMQAQLERSEEYQEEMQIKQELQATSNREGDLEVQMVAQMAPLVMNGGDSSLNYSPVLDAQHSAAPLHDL